jgi:hypothetical protein
MEQGNRRIRLWNKTSDKVSKCKQETHLESNKPELDEQC